MQRFSSCYLVVASLKFPFFWAIPVSSDPIHNIMISKSVFSWIFTNTFPLGGQFINFLTFQKWSAQLSGNISRFQSQLYLNYFHFWMVICYCWVLTIWPNIPDPRFFPFNQKFQFKFSEIINDNWDNNFWNFNFLEISWGKFLLHLTFLFWLNGKCPWPIWHEK